MKGLIFSIAAALSCCAGAFAQVAITPGQTSLDMGGMGTTMSARAGAKGAAKVSASPRAPRQTASASRAQKQVRIEPKERYKIASATKVGGAWHIRIFDAVEKKTYSMRNGYRHSACGVLVEKFHPESATADIDTPQGKFTVGMKVPDKVANLQPKQDAKKRPAAAAKKVEIDPVQAAARAKTKANISPPAASAEQL